jgi:hypothetical protein
VIPLRHLVTIVNLLRSIELAEALSSAFERIKIQYRWKYYSFQSTIQRSQKQIIKVDAETQYQWRGCYVASFRTKNNCVQHKYSIKMICGPSFLDILASIFGFTNGQTRGRITGENKKCRYFFIYFFFPRANAFLILSQDGNSSIVTFPNKERRYSELRRFQTFPTWTSSSLGPHFTLHRMSDTEKPAVTSFEVDLTKYKVSEAI